MRVYVEAYGCAQNLGEADALTRHLDEAGHPRVADPSRADVGVLVTCGVIGATEARMVRRARALRARLPRLVVTGCLVPLRTGLFDPADDRTTFLPIREQESLPRLLDDWGAGRTPSAFDDPEPGEPSATAEVILAQGCTSACSYCFSRLARGRLTSVPVPDVLARVAEAHRRGAVEIRLSSLDTSCWGADLPGSGGLPGLLEALQALPGEFGVRVGMMSPQSLAPISERLFSALSDPRFFRFLHLPVQSGSNRVLDAMRRGYRVEEFAQLVADGRARLADLTLATDIIVGFPEETEAEFDETLRLIETTAPEIVNVTRFSPRPMTPAARLPPLPSGTVKRRSRALTDLRLRLARARLERWIGWEGPAWVVEPGTRGTRVARLPNYLPVVLPTRGRLGRRVTVRVEGARSTYLLGREVAPEAGVRPALPL